MKAQKPDTPVTATQPTQPPKNWAVNCPKCGATLNLKEGGYAFLCPVCNSILKIRTDERPVIEQKEEKYLQVRLTEKTTELLKWSEAEMANSKKAQKAAKVLWKERAIHALTYEIMNGATPVSKRKAKKKAKKLVKKAENTAVKDTLETLLAGNANTEETLTVAFSAKGFTLV